MDRQCVRPDDDSLTHHIRVQRALRLREVGGAREAVGGRDREIKVRMDPGYLFLVLLPRMLRSAWHIEVRGVGATGLSEPAVFRHQSLARSWTEPIATALETGG